MKAVNVAPVPISFHCKSRFQPFSVRSKVCAILFSPFSGNTNNCNRSTLSGDTLICTGTEVSVGGVTAGGVTVGGITSPGNLSASSVRLQAAIRIAAKQTRIYNLSLFINFTTKVYKPNRAASTQISKCGTTFNY